MMFRQPHNPLSKMIRANGTASCATCGKTISGNKVWCAAHIPDQSNNSASVNQRLEWIAESHKAAQVV